MRITIRALRWVEEQKHSLRFERHEEQEHAVTDDDAAADEPGGPGEEARSIRLGLAPSAVRRPIDFPESAQHSIAVSPDGRWMAYASNETGSYEVWLEPLPGTGARHLITRNGGSHPLWLPDGRSLYFDRDHQMFQLAVNLNDPTSISEPVALPINGFAQAEYRRQFDLMPNGRQFVMLFLVPVE